MSHANARLTVHGRLLIVERVRVQGRPQAHTARELGVSRKTVKYWLDRYDAEGEAGLQDRSSRPHLSPRRTPAEVEQQVLQVRRIQRRGQDWLGPELGLAPRTVSRILRRHGMPYLGELDPLTGEQIRSPRPPRPGTSVTVPAS